MAHETLEGPGAPASGNLQAALREARHRLIADWARRRGLAAVALGHTLEDQAETVLMRLARGSGVDGLAAMRETAEREVTLFRPLLGERRAVLRDWLRDHGRTWCDDPSNADPRFDRVKAREALGHLAPLGLTPERLGLAAAHMARAADALDWALDGWAASRVERRPTGEIAFPRADWAALPAELRFRLLARLLGEVGGQTYRPRFEALGELAAALVEDVPRPLHGCLVFPGERVVVTREPAAVDPPVPVTGPVTLWDSRWRVGAPAGSGPGLTVGALGEAGLAALSAPPSEVFARAPRAARLTTPAVRDAAGRLVAAPLAGPAAAAGWTAQLVVPGARHRRDGLSV